jgi:hypothetical protein
MRANPDPDKYKRQGTDLDTLVDGQLDQTWLHQTEASRHNQQYKRHDNSPRVVPQEAHQLH